MARGIPGLVSTLVALPLAVTGAYVVMADTGHSAVLAAPFLIFAAFVLALGLYVQFVGAPDGPSMRDGEEMIAKRHPIQRVATVKIIIGLPLLIAAAYLFFETLVPLVYPTVALLAGLYFLSSGLQTYWVNSLTTYYLTNQRVIREYRFIALARQEVPLKKVRGVEERRSLIETFVGLGNVRVTSGGGRALSVVMANINDPRGFADEVRRYV